jgi:hypothetical protein
MKKKILMLLLLVVCCLAVTAKKKEIYSCELTLNNGQKVKGWVIKDSYSKYGGYMIKNMNEITIANAKEDKKGTVYNADDAKSLVISNDETGDKVEYLSLYATKNFTKPENLVPSNHKYFWQIAYKGKNVYGFCSESSTYEMSLSGYNIKKNSGAFSYCLKGDQIAVYFYISLSGTVLGEKSELKRQFARFPKMVSYIEGDDVKVKEIKNDPFMLLEKLDKMVAK